MRGVSENNKSAKSWLAFIEQPLFLTTVSLVCSILGLAFYTPVLVICGLFALLAFKRFGWVSGKAPSFQLFAYVVFALIVASGLWGLHFIPAIQSKQAAREIASQVSQMLNMNTQTTRQTKVSASDERIEQLQSSKLAVQKVPRASATILHFAPQTQMAPAQTTSQQTPASAPRTISWEQFNAAIERQVADCQAKLEAAPSCTGGDLSRCSDKKLLEWSKPLIEQITPIDDQYLLDLKIASSYNGTKLIKAMDVTKREAADKYRRCCANDALQLYKEMAHRVGGGKDDLDFYDWSEQLLAPINSNAWKIAISNTDTHLLNVRYNLDILSKDLELAVENSCFNSVRANPQIP